MQIVIWILIILAIIFLIWFLRKWIKRIIFILILLCLAFLIYGIFSPSGAARLWYNVRTFPQRVTSWVSSGKEFLDYDSYKLSLPSVKDVDLDINLDKESDIEKEVKDTSDVEIQQKNDKEEEKIEVIEPQKSDEDGKVIRSFAGNTSLNFVKMKVIDGKSVENGNIYTEGSKTELLGIINSYIDKNLDDDTDIAVTIEYEGDLKDPDRVVLKTQPKTVDSPDIEVEDLDDEDIDEPEDDNVIHGRQPNQLTQKELREAQELFSILF